MSWPTTTAGLSGARAAKSRIRVSRASTPPMSYARTTTRTSLTPEVINVVRPVPGPVGRQGFEVRAGLTSPVIVVHRFRRYGESASVDRASFSACRVDGDHALLR